MNHNGHPSGALARENIQPENNAAEQTPGSVPHSVLYAAVALGAPLSAHAGIITNSDLGLSGFTVSPSSGDVAWNIDGSGAPEFGFSTSIGGGLIFQIALTSGGGAGIAQTTAPDRFLPIVGGSVVGAGNSYFVPTLCGDLIAVDNAVFCGGVDLDLWSDFPGVGADFSGSFGFRFNNGGTFNYGVADFSFADFDGSSEGTFSIHGWRYDDMGNRFVEPGDHGIPEPATSALVGLALGAMGVRRRRQTATSH